MVGTSAAIEQSDCKLLKRNIAAILASGVAAAFAYLLARTWNARLDSEGERLGRLVGGVPGARIAEVGAGNGAMAFRIAKHLGPTGVLIATDVAPDKLKVLQRKKLGLSLRNVTVLPASERDSGLPSLSCQGAYLRGAYHHLTHPRDINHSIFNALVPGGVLAIVDFPPRLLLKPWTPRGIPRNRGGHGVREQIVVRDLRAAGFVYLRRTDWRRGTYCLLFQKPA